MEVSEQFKLLLEALKGYQSSFLDSGYKTVGFMAVALGWLVTSKDARAFLAEARPARWVALVFLSVLAIAYVYMARRVTRVSKSVFDKLESLNYSDPSVYVHYLIKPDLWIYYSGVHILISILILIVAWEAKVPASPASPP